jgi:hypothetical protein
MSTATTLDQARAALDACAPDDPRFPAVHRAFCEALDADDRYQACDHYVPSEEYGSICADCNIGGWAHRSFNPQGGAW